MDAGASLTKLTLQTADGAFQHALVPPEAAEALTADLARWNDAHIGLTGCGAARLASALGRDIQSVQEFAAWGAGARALLQQAGDAPTRYLLVSLGTGTSVMLADGHAVSRVGGTALGGGTLVGLGAAVLGVTDFEALRALAESGDRRNVDLLVSDIYRPGEIPLLGDITAAAFGKLARPAHPVEDARREDLAHAVFGLVGENVALLCGGLANAFQVTDVVYAGSTLRANRVLRDTLQLVTSAIGREPRFPTDAEFAGSLGALLLASEPS